MPHMLAYVLKFKVTYLNGSRCFRNFGAQMSQTLFPDREILKVCTNEKDLVRLHGFADSPEPLQFERQQNAASV